MITNIISKLDVVLAQVLIEALVVEVTLGSDADYGISYVQNQVKSGRFASGGAINPDKPGFINPGSFGSISTNAAQSGLPSGFSYFMKGGDLDIAFNAFASDSRARILSRPRIQTSHAVPASLFVGETRPYPTGSAYGGYYGAYNTIQQLDIGIELSVLPLINPDGLVVMEIMQRVQSVGKDVEIANVGKVPSTIDRTANAKVAVRDRETIILGGFITSEDRRSHSGVPVLKDIPLLGALFRGASRNNNRQEIIVFIRPTVLPTPEIAAQVAGEETRKLPGVSAAQKAFEQEDKIYKEKFRKEEEAIEKKQRNKKITEPAPSPMPLN